MGMVNLKKWVLRRLPKTAARDIATVRQKEKIINRDLAARDRINSLVKKPFQEVISILKIEANRIRFKKIQPLKMRESFDFMKRNYYQEWQGEKCGACKSNPIQNIHHMMLIKNGGINHRENLIGLCKDCHALIHPWLKNRFCLKSVDSTGLKATL
jgi:hypothetical protein